MAFLVFSAIANPFLGDRTIGKPNENALGICEYEITEVARNTHFGIFD